MTNQTGGGHILSVDQRDICEGAPGARHGAMRESALDQITWSVTHQTQRTRPESKLDQIPKNATHQTTRPASDLEQIEKPGNYIEPLKSERITESQKQISNEQSQSYPRSDAKPLPVLNENSSKDHRIGQDPKVNSEEPVHRTAASNANKQNNYFYNYNVISENCRDSLDTSTYNPKFT